MRRIVCPKTSTHYTGDVTVGKVDPGTTKQGLMDATKENAKEER